MDITNDIKYVGVNDHDIDLFEGQYVVENGMAYNSYMLMDEKTAVFDTVDARFGEEWLANIKAVSGLRQPDYLIIQHMEPDHSANIAKFMELYPETKIVSSAKAFVMMKQFFGTDFADRQTVVKDGDTLSRHITACKVVYGYFWAALFLQFFCQKLGSFFCVSIGGGIGDRYAFCFHGI